MISNPSTTSLQDAIAAFLQTLASTAPPAVLEKVGAELQSLAMSSYGKASPAVGARAPAFALPDVRGEIIQLESVLAKGPAIVTFYRGSWCPFCDLQLRAYQGILPELRALGATLLAISPQTPDNSLSTAEKKALTFPVLSDVGNEVARRYGLVFPLSRGLQELHAMFGNELPRFNGNDSWELPVPATFVVDKHGVVRFASFDPNYTKRTEPAALLAALQQLG
jgi:peroxiredoxin